MVKYLFSKLLSKFLSDEKLINLSQKLVNSIINNTGTMPESRSLMISSVEDVIHISKHRFVKFICTNVSLTSYEVLICDTGVISMSINNSVFKNFDHVKYSLYIKEIRNLT